MPFCFPEGIAIDSSASARLSLISHAHSDHGKIGNADRHMMTPATKALLQEKINKQNKKAKIHTPGFNEKFEFENAKISLHDSGHILGSAQFLIENAESTTAFTNDFKLQGSIIQKGAEVLKADTLVIESTFGMPEYAFPERSEVYAQMASWIRQNLRDKKFIVLFGYALGKAQELTKFANEFCGISHIVHEKIYENNKIYEKFGIKLGDYSMLDHNLSNSSMLIMPTHMFSNDLLQIIAEYSKRQVASAIASGWILRNYPHSKVFPLSDHADFPQLMHYIRQSEPKTVLTNHDFEREFENYIRRKLRINARALTEQKQSYLQEFV